MGHSFPRSTVSPRPAFYHLLSFLSVSPNIPVPFPEGSSGPGVRGRGDSASRGILPGGRRSGPSDRVQSPCGSAWVLGSGTRALRRLRLGDSGRARGGSESRREASGRHSPERTGQSHAAPRDVQASGTPAAAAGSACPLGQCQRGQRHRELSLRPKNFFQLPAESKVNGTLPKTSQGLPPLYSLHQVPAALAERVRRQPRPVGARTAEMLRPRRMWTRSLEESGPPEASTFPQHSDSQVHRGGIRTPALHCPDPPATHPATRSARQQNHHCPSEPESGGWA